MPDGANAYPAYFKNELSFQNQSSKLYMDILNSTAE